MNQTSSSSIRPLEDREAGVIGEKNGSDDVAEDWEAEEGLKGLAAPATEEIEADDSGEERRGEDARSEGTK